MSIKSKIHAKLNRITSINPDQDNLSPYLADIYFFTEMKKYADDKVKSTYKLLVKDDLIPTDDELRALDNHVVIKSPSFTMTSKTSAPRQSFDKDAFINAISSEFNIPKQKLMRIAEKTKKVSITPLTKAVIENSL